jgi:hypothetical protein
MVALRPAYDERMTNGLETVLSGIPGTATDRNHAVYLKL